jgi:hypothetical protein
MDRLFKFKLTTMGTAWHGWGVFRGLGNGARSPFGINVGASIIKI